MKLNICRDCDEHVLAVDYGVQDLPDADGNFMQWYVTEFACDCVRIISKTDYEVCDSQPDPPCYRNMIDMVRYYRKWFDNMLPEDLRDES